VFITITLHDSVTDSIRCSIRCCYRCDYDYIRFDSTTICSPPIPVMGIHSCWRCINRFTLSHSLRYIDWYPFHWLIVVDSPPIPTGIRFVILHFTFICCSIHSQMHIPTIPFHVTPRSHLLLHIHSPFWFTIYDLRYCSLPRSRCSLRLLRLFTYVTIVYIHTFDSHSPHGILRWLPFRSFTFTTFMIPHTLLRSIHTVDVRWASIPTYYIRYIRWFTILPILLFTFDSSFPHSFWPFYDWFILRFDCWLLLSIHYSVFHSFPFHSIPDWLTIDPQWPLIPFPILFPFILHSMIFRYLHSIRWYRLRYRAPFIPTIRWYSIHSWLHHLFHYDLIHDSIPHDWFHSFTIVRFIDIPIHSRFTFTIRFDGYSPHSDPLHVTFYLLIPHHITFIPLSHICYSRLTIRTGISLLPRFTDYVRDLFVTWWSLQWWADLLRYGRLILRCCSVIYRRWFYLVRSVLRCSRYLPLIRYVPYDSDGGGGVLHSICYYVYHIPGIPHVDFYV